MEKYLSMVTPADVETQILDWGVFQWLSEPRVTGVDKMVVGIGTVKPGKGHVRHNHPDSQEFICFLKGKALQTICIVFLPFLSPGFPVFSFLLRFFTYTYTKEERMNGIMTISIPRYDVEYEITSIKTTAVKAAGEVSIPKGTTRYINTRLPTMAIKRGVLINPYCKEIKNAVPTAIIDKLSSPKYGRSSAMVTAEASAIISNALNPKENNSLQTTMESDENKNIAKEPNNVLFFTIGIFNGRIEPTIAANPSPKDRIA